MKKAEVQLPESLYRKVEVLADQLRLTVPELLRRTAEQLVSRRLPTPPTPNGDWKFPDGHHLGKFRAPVADWRLLGT